MCNDRTFCVGRLMGHGVSGRYIVVLGHSCRMFGCLDILVMGLPRPQWRHSTPMRWGVSLVSGALASGCTKVIRVVIVIYCELPEL